MAGKALTTKAAQDALKLFDSYAATTNAREVGGEREKLAFDSVGDFCVMKLVAVATGGKKVLENGVEIDKTFRVLHLDSYAGGAYYVSCGTDLEQKIHGDLVNHVIGIQRVGDKDVQKQSPMTVYRVIDFGMEWPEFAKELKDADLPF